MRRPVAPLALALALATTAIAAPALAGSLDTVQGARFDVVERSDVVDVKVDRGHATLVVTRVVHNPGPKSDEAMFHIHLPTGAVATRLRTAATNARGETVWFEGELMEAEAAAAKYKELTGIGGYYPKDPALLSWRSQNHLALQVFPVPAKSDKIVEYTLQIPLTYENGAYRAKIEPMGTNDLPAQVRLSAAHPEDSLAVNGVKAASATVAMTREIEIELTPKPATRIDGALASVPFAIDRNLVHARLDAAPRLGEVPQGAAVAVVIDASKSMTNELPSAVAVARDYLSHFAHAEVTVVTFDRKAQTPFGTAISPRDATTKLYGWQPKPANGSHLDVALEQADKVLAASRAPVRRIVVLTDLATRRALTPERFAARTLASGATVHVAAVGSGPAHLAREDESPWATLPRRTGGLLWTARSDGRSDAASRALFEELARPKRIEKLAVRGLPADFTAPDELLEGQGLEHFVIAPKRAATVTLTGELWSTPVAYSFAPSADEGRRWSALVFGSPLLHQLTEKEMMPLALNGRAVSPVTSYLAIEPGVRPSTEGLEEGEGGMGGGGAGSGIGLGSIGTIGHGSGTGTSFDHDAFLRGALEGVMHACNATGAAQVVLETTFDEIVEVRDVKATPALDAKTAACVSEGMWGVDLPSRFSAAEGEWTAKAKR